MPQSTKLPRTKLLFGAISTLGTFGLMQVVRLIAGVAIARLLSPELLGIMTIVYVLRFGVELLSDIGIRQSVISNREGDQPDFYNTAWTLQIGRGFGLSLVFLLATVPVSKLYDAPILLWILPVISSYFAIVGFTSTQPFLLARRMQTARLNGFDVALEIISAVGRVGLAFVSPTIWALVFGSLIQPIARTIGSHFLIPGVGHRLYISKDYARQIFHFGKWILVTAVLFFLASNFDRLYLAKVIPFALLGVFGIARNLSGMVTDGIARLCSIVVFPLVAAEAAKPRTQLRADLAPVRLAFVMICAFCLSIFVTLGDFIIAAMYDHRYQAAGWMLPVLVTGLWFSILASLNESILIGVGRPKYTTVASSSKLLLILVGLPLATTWYGISGAVGIIAFGDLPRYCAILFGQRRLQLSFLRQDAIATVAFFALILLWEYVRLHFHLGTSFDNIP